ncbi:MAG: hypothetical protein NUV82_04220 [Candidatus Komeilibacteria bacterium]|nr:hypothetical protein [Candidatus Komeilibacteria bacterium]
MNITIINDCRDANAAGRQITRVSTLIGNSASFVGVSSDLEAAGNLIDVLDAYENSPGVILVNVAPRNGKAKKWKNGTPFGYFWHKEVLVVSSIDGLTLSLVKKIGLVDSVHVLDIPKVIEQFISERLISPEVGEYIINTQFRSYDFLPRIAAYLLENRYIQSDKMKIEYIADAPNAIWWVDNFGNCKTTLFTDEIIQPDHVNTKFGKISYFEWLKDVPDKTTALITGSSGIGDKRFLEIVVQGGSASKILNARSADEI